MKIGFDLGIATHRPSDPYAGNIIENPTFTGDGSPWTFSSGWALTDGVPTNDTGSGALAQVQGGIADGDSYRLIASFTVDGGGLFVRLGSSTNVLSYFGDLDYQIDEIITADGGNNRLIFQAPSSYRGVVRWAYLIPE